MDQASTPVPTAAVPEGDATAPAEWTTWGRPAPERRRTGRRVIPLIAAIVTVLAAVAGYLLFVSGMAGPVGGCGGG